MLSICLGVFSQEITVRFTGQLNGTSYCQLDSVAVINLSRNWMETVVYPDTIIVLGGTVGTDLNIAATQGLGQNIPNPFDCETRVELSLSQRENVRMQLLVASGRQYADYRGSLDAGVHTFDISAANPQTYILNAVVGDRSYSIRMVNMGSGCGSSIKYAGISGSITAKLTTANEFQNGDNMHYIGYVTIGSEVVASNVVEQPQTASEDITLNFSHCQPLAEQVEVTACDSYDWNNEIYTENGDYQQTFVAANGCDSVVTLRLIINHSNTGIDEQTTCDSYTWIDGVTYTESTTEPTFTLTNAAGCDSIVTLNLTINRNTGIDTQTACETYTWIDGVTYTASTNEPTFTLTNAAGCDSVVTLHLTIVCPPTVQTNVATGVTTTGVTLNGNVTSDGGATVTARGFLYGTSSSNLTQTVQSGSGTGNYTKALTGLTSSTTYYYKAYATNSEGTAYGEVLSFTTPAYDYSDPTGYTNGYGYVDLGLPSGTLWATCNVGANSPTAYGDYFAWGETTAKTTYDWSTYIYCNGSNRTLTKYCSNSSWGDNGFTDNLTILEASDDAATANWGTGWRMPTYDELNELQSNCTVTWTTQNGVNGRLFIGPNRNSIFLPAAGFWSYSDFFSDGNLGYYWSSSLYYNTDYPIYARDFEFFSDTYVMGSYYRNSGLSVRPVRASSTSYSEPTGYVNGYGYVDLGLPSGTFWANCNVGANNPTAYGDYYAWGETTTKETYSWDTYRYCNGSFTTLTKYCNNSSLGNNGFTDNLTTLEASDDAATANWGAGWRMPTSEELNELKNSCTVTWTTLNGVNGRLFTGPNGNSIFLPAAGRRFVSDLYGAGSYGDYWSSSLYVAPPGNAWYLDFDSGNYGMYSYDRDYGQSVRPVCAQ